MERIDKLEWLSEGICAFCGSREEVIVSVFVEPDLVPGICRECAELVAATFAQKDMTDS